MRTCKGMHVNLASRSRISLSSCWTDVAKEVSGFYCMQGAWEQDRWWSTVWWNPLPYLTDRQAALETPESANRKWNQFHFRPSYAAMQVCTHVWFTNVPNTCDQIARQSRFYPRSAQKSMHTCTHAQIYVQVQMYGHACTPTHAQWRIQERSSHLWYSVHQSEIIAVLPRIRRRESEHLYYTAPHLHAKSASTVWRLSISKTPHKNVMYSVDGQIDLHERRGE